MRLMASFSSSATLKTSRPTATENLDPFEQRQVGRAENRLHGGSMRKGELQGEHAAMAINT